MTVRIATAIAAIAMLINLTVFAQQQVLIGQKLPGVKVANVINYSASQLNLSDFQGKLVIIDFWSTKCAACIRAFSKLDSLQKQFNDRIQIILVSYESKEVIQSFLKQHKKLVIPKLPMITSDSLLVKLFPHEALPFHVWINQKGVFTYQTDGVSTTKKTINDFLSTGKTVLSRPPVRYKTTDSYFDKKYEGAVLFYSYLALAIDTVRLNVKINKEGIHFTEIGSIIDLLTLAFNEEDRFNFNSVGRVVLHVKDSSRFIYLPDRQSRSSWEEGAVFTYDLLLPKTQAAMKYKIMQEELCRYFGLKARVERQAVKCMALIRTGTKDKLASAGGSPVRQFYWTDYRSTRFDSVRCLKNQPFQLFSNTIGNWVEKVSHCPFADETNYSGNIDIQIKGDIMDSMNLGRLRKELNKYNLDLVEKTCALDVLVIQEN